MDYLPKANANLSSHPQKNNPNGFSFVQPLVTKTTTLKSCCTANLLCGCKPHQQKPSMHVDSNEVRLFSRKSYNLQHKIHIILKSYFANCMSSFQLLFNAAKYSYCTLVYLVIRLKSLSRDIELTMKEEINVLTHLFY